MTLSEAKGFIMDYYYDDNPTDETFFLFEEAMLYLIENYHDPKDMHNLAFAYLSQRRFDLECKYLEMAAEYNYGPSLEELGYIWYYGQTGTVDYEKAFKYFSRAMECDDEVLRAYSEYKIADMYHNGFYVKKDEAKYRSMIESLYDRISHPEKLGQVYDIDSFPMPDIAYRLAGIRAEEGKDDEALKLLSKAKRQLQEDIRNNPSWWGNIEVMERIVLLSDKISSKDKKQLGIYDLFWISKKECKIAFLYKNRRFIIDVTEGNIRFENKWYRSAADFFEKAEIDARKIVYLYDELFDMEVCYE